MRTITIDHGGQPVEVQLRRAGPEDRDLDQLLIEIDTQTFAESTFSEFTAHALARHGCAWVLNAQDRGVAFLIALRDFHVPDRALLLSMGIVPGWRGHGLGEFLLHEVLHDLRQLGFGSATLHIGGRNTRALKVYLDAGFVEIHREVDPADADDVRIRMEITL